jgi:hypothetical protein
MISAHSNHRTVVVVAVALLLLTACGDDGLAYSNTVPASEIDPAEIDFGEPHDISYEPASGPPGTVIKFSSTCVYKKQPAALFVRVFRRRIENDEDGLAFDFFVKLEAPTAKGVSVGSLTVPADAVPGKYGIEFVCSGGDQVFGDAEGPWEVTAPKSG